VKSCLKNKTVWAMVAYAYNPSYLEGWDHEDCGLRPAQANN
jgi:hypothetical protein